MAPFRAITQCVLTLSLVTATLASQVTRPSKSRTPPASRSNLFAGVSGRFLQANRVGCFFDSDGEACADPETEDGFWPRPTFDTYIFASGIQVAGLIPPGAGFAWAGDTVGAYFMDFRGDQRIGVALTSLLDSRDTGDLRTWPPAALVRDTALFATPLLGHPNVADEDYWTRFWDQNLSPARKHPMGIAVDERVMAFTGPGYNGDILYFVYTFTNVTASDPAAYAGIDPAIRSDYAALGAKFKQANDSAFGVTIPTGGYRIDSVFVDEAMDPDVGANNASANYSTPSFPFGVSFAYEGPFQEPSWSYPADVFGGRGLAPAPGLVGVEFLRYPVDSAGKQVGIRIWSNTVDAATAYADPVGIDQLYRYLSGTSAPSAGDLPCTDQSNRLILKYCVAWQHSADTRFFVSSGPFTLAPGQQQTIVLAYLFAAPRDTVNAYLGGDLTPGYPATGDSIAADTTRVRLIERIAGWVTQVDANADGVIEENEVKTWPGSLLNKAQIAQAYADAKFLTPQAPASPGFYLIPGNRQVTVVWQKSATEGAGDPYFAIASDPASALYDPNFRHFDVEGYRIYRGMSPGALQVVAQFDYAGTVMPDYLGAFDYGTPCAPELGVLAGCPVTFPATPSSAIHSDHPLVSPLVQVPLGGRVLTANGAIQAVHEDTAVTGGATGFPGLMDNGVPFSYVDVTVLNSFTYYYAVTAFDVNSIRSGPTSLESPRLVKSVIPRTGGTVVDAQIVTAVYGDDSVPLATAAPYPAIDPATGTFSGPIPPATAWTFNLITAAATEVLPRGRILARVDSLRGGFEPSDLYSLEPVLYLTLTGGKDTVHEALPLDGSFEAGPSTGTTAPVLVPDSGAPQRYGGRADTGTETAVTLTASIGPIQAASPAAAVVSAFYTHRDTASRYLAHSRWFDEGGAEPAQPTIVGNPSPTHNSGQLTGVTEIWAPQAYRSDSTAPVGTEFRFYSEAAAAWYPADFTVTWKADSSVTVRDLTHHVTLPLSTGGAGFGFVNLRAFTAAGITSGQLTDGSGTTNVSIVSYHHLYAMPPVCQGPPIGPIPCIALERKAQYEPLDFNSDGAADANGIVIVINGEAFFMSTGQIPAAGTKWHLRAVSGTMSATCTPALGPVMLTCSGYAFTPPPVAPGVVPGLQFVIDIQRAFAVDTAISGDLSKVHTVPDPLYVTNSLATSDTQHVEFVHLPARAIIRIYSVSGRLVATLTHNDVTGGGQEDWNVHTRDGKTAASGVYFYVVEGPDHRTKVGRFTLITYRP